MNQAIRHTTHTLISSRVKRQSTGWGKLVEQCQVLCVARSGQAKKMGNGISDRRPLSPSQMCRVVVKKGEQTQFSLHAVQTEHVFSCVSTVLRFERRHRVRDSRTRYVSCLPTGTTPIYNSDWVARELQLLPSNPFTFTYAIFATPTSSHPSPVRFTSDLGKPVVTSSPSPLSSTSCT